MIHVVRVTYRQQRDGNFSKEIRGFVSIFIKHCHFQNIVNILNRAGTKKCRHIKIIFNTYAHSLLHKDLRLLFY